MSYRPTTALAQAVTFDDITMHVQLIDDRTMSVPLQWFPRLQAAQPEQRAQVHIGGGGRGLHWDELDKNLSVAAPTSPTTCSTYQPFNIHTLC